MQENFAKAHSDFEKACVDFESVQQEQLAAMEVGNLKDMMPMHDRRERAFCRVQEILGKIDVASSSSEDLDFLEWLQGRLGGLLETEKILDEAVSVCQKKVICDLGDLRKGKTALKGYSIKHGKAPDARFMSKNG